ncbi:hypothetical protein CAPTEDRAFT_216718 [Capitella teleta]|uniref:Uncharacterized protein n=1 Tax=Capitella teleta TaxID=283909 RepID=R7T5M3_CAPTE|nr:hypothetical protein CAPTEDRAFT_216718 [Capitella teleta]|eukprot:ELT88669.1 hypothetical protein CAPTEDRAFT_216718 [Capitella teleta]
MAANDKTDIVHSTAILLELAPMLIPHFVMALKNGVLTNTSIDPLGHSLFSKRSSTPYKSPFLRLLEVIFFVIFDSSQMPLEWLHLLTLVDEVFVRKSFGVLPFVFPINMRLSPHLKERGRDQPAVELSDPFQPTKAAICANRQRKDMIKQVGDHSYADGNSKRSVKRTKRLSNRNLINKSQEVQLPQRQWRTLRFTRGKLRIILFL